MNGKVIIGCELETKSFDAQIEELENDLDDLVEIYKILENSKPFDGQEKELRKLKSEIQKTSNKLVDLRKKQQEAGKSEFIENINKGLSNTIKKVGRWAIALLGIQSAYSAVRSAMSTLSQYDDQMTSNIEYIKYALANALKPIIEWILNAVVQLLQYINAIAKAWTGKNLFSTADSFNEAKNNAKKLNKELNKTTSSFDEINKVSKSSASGVSGGTDVTPNIDLTKLQGEIPEWMQWIIDHKDEVVAGLSAIAGALLGVALNLKPLQTIGLALVFSGVTLTYEGLKNFALGNYDWQTILETVLGPLSIGAGTFMLTKNITLALAVTATVLTTEALSELSIFWDDIKGDIEENGGFWNNWGEGIKVIADDVQNKLDNTSFAKLGEEIEDNGGFWESWKQGIGVIANDVQGKVDKINFAELGSKISTGISNVGSMIGTGISDATSAIGNFITVTIPNKINRGINAIGGFLGNIGAKAGEIVGSAFKAVVNGILWAIENILNFPIRAINKLIGVINKVPGINLGKLSTFNLPRLAKGGIINQPGRGIPVGYGQAIAGERGQEGVLPLTDSQQMALLGETIGKYVRIDNVIDVNMDSRRINRILQSSNNRVSFAGNR